VLNLIKKKKLTVILYLFNIFARKKKEILFFLLDGSDFTDAVLNLFLLAWFIVGQIWTWPVYMPNFEFGLENPNKYCHRNVYIFILVHIAFVYVMFLAAILFLIALACCARFPHLIVKTPR
jgi:hypothetical protein